MNAPGALGERGHTLLLTAKLHRPVPQTQLVRRPRLSERLAHGMTGPLTLVSAPAGFGKTTLLAQWLSEGGLPAAWLSLEPQDNEPVRFLSYLISALQTVDPRLGSLALSLLQPPEPAAPETILTLLSNDVLTCTPDHGAFVLVLDDYHVIEDASVHRALAFLLEHSPPQMHLIIATRADPPLPLARLRARGQLTELRAAELRFSAEETQTFLRTAMGLHLSTAEMDLLMQRTEGWIAGLQLAALSIRGRSDVPDFLSAFSGSHRFVLDYLTDEVLARQPANVRAFLLYTSILERLSGPLCDRVTGQEGSQELLETIERGNLFVAGLDDERRWYRYHQLFADALRTRLQQEQPLLVLELHRRASAWYEEQGLIVEAVQHALAVPDEERGALLLEGNAAAFLLGGHAQVLAWFKRLPEALVRSRPRLCLLHATALMLTHQHLAAASRLRDAEAALPAAAPAAEAGAVMGQIAILRGGLARYSGNLALSVALARQALDLLPQTEVMQRQAALMTVAQGFRVSGDVTAESEGVVLNVTMPARASSNVVVRLRGISLLAQLRVTQGRLREALDIYGEAAQIMPGQAGPEGVAGSAYYFFGLGDLLRERCDLDEADRVLAQGMGLIGGALIVFAETIMLGYVAFANLQRARGDFETALHTLQAFTDLAQQRSFTPLLLSQVAARQARIELAQGNLAAALSWRDECGLAADDDDLPFPREGEYLTLARVRIAEARRHSAGTPPGDFLGLLRRLQARAEATGRMGSVLEILIMRALAFDAQGDEAQALATLGRALRIAEPQGYIRLFLDEGEPIMALLRRAVTQGAAPSYAATLLAAAGAPARAGAAPAHPLIEPLTQREREVLRLLAAGLSNAAIAQELVVTVGTTKTHINHIYDKLGVRSRAQAIARGHTLQLL